MFPLDHRLHIPGNHHGGGTVYQVGTDIEPIDTHPFDGRSGKDDSAGDTRFILQSGCHEDRNHRRLCRSDVYGRILRSYSSWTEPAGSYPPIERVLPVERPPQEDVQNRAYAAAVVLTIIVLVLSFGGRYMMAHFSKNKV